MKLSWPTKRVGGLVESSRVVDWRDVFETALDRSTCVSGRNWEREAWTFAADRLRMSAAVQLSAGPCTGDRGARLQADAEQLLGMQLHHSMLLPAVHASRSDASKVIRWRHRSMLSY